MILTARAFGDLERISEFTEAQGSDLASEIVDVLTDALAILARHPLMGRPAEDGMRELVISRGRTGYLALYDYVEHDDLVRVLAIRHQREAGYTNA